MFSMAKFLVETVVFHIVKSEASMASGVIVFTSVSFTYSNTVPFNVLMDVLTVCVVGSVQYS